MSEPAVVLNSLFKIINNKYFGDSSINILKTLKELLMCVKNNVL